MRNLSSPTIDRILTILCAVALFSFAGCTSFQRIGIALLYQEASLPPQQVMRDIPYAEDGATESKHRLDLFVPGGTNWPVMIFVHGGGWDSGDKGLRFGGADVYGNIGRYFASQGVGVAIVNYRLQPQVGWKQQVSDVANAVNWMRNHAVDYGGNPQKLFLAGHSAGAHLVSFVALELRASMKDNPGIAGVIAVSGAALDLVDEESYRLGQNRRYYEQRFKKTSTNENWPQEASPIAYIQNSAPPFLVLYGENEKRSLQRQSRLLHQALSAKGVESRMMEIPGQSHARIVLTLSRPDKVSAPVILKFIKEH